LSDYQGCLLIVSHDRYFMDRLVDHLFVFEGDGVISDYPGNYSQYRIAQKQKEKDSLKSAEKKNEPVAAPLKPVVGMIERRKPSQKERREFELLEQEMAKLEAEKTTISEKMATPSLPFDELTKLGNRITEITTLQENKEMRWLELSELM